MTQQLSRANKFPEYLANDSIEMWIDSGILFCSYREGVHIGLAEAVSSIRLRNNLLNGRVMPLLVDITGIKVLEKQARDFLGSSEVMRGTSAGALVVKQSIYARTIGNIFFVLSRPVIPHRIFESQQKALRWLEGYK